MIRSLLLLMLRVHAGLFSRLRNLGYRVLGVQMTGYSWLRKIEIPRNPNDIKLGRVSLDRDIVLLTTGGDRGEPRIVVENGVYINRYTFLDASEKIIIREKAMIGPFCYITDHDHVITDEGVSGEVVGSPTEIGRKAWVGAHVTVLKGVSIGEGAVVGAGSVVTRDVPAYSVVAGNPARVIRQRGAV